MDLTITEENYIKAIYLLAENDHKQVMTNELAHVLKTSAAAITDMIQKLHQKGIVHYQKYQGVSLTNLGKAKALQVLRRHRLWEVFLCNKLHFKWDEIEVLAESLKHIQSEVLIQKLADYLGNPTHSPHGEPIPDEKGNLPNQSQLLLEQLTPGIEAKIVAVKDDSASFLQYLAKRGLYLGAHVKVIEKVPFDASLEILLDKKVNTNIASKAAEKILVIC